MNYDTIKLLNLEDINIDLTKSHVDKVNGNIFLLFFLFNIKWTATIPPIPRPKTLNFSYYYLQIYY